MRLRIIAMVALVALCSATAMAELQQVQVGGSLRIRGNYYNLDSLGKYSFIEQRTRLNVQADFTDAVSAFIEFDYYNFWGEDFRSNYLTGADWRGGQNNVDLYQGYINMANMWGTPLHLRVGRQEFSLGNAFFIGTNDDSAFFSGLSFDALLLSYVHESFMLHAVTAKLVETYGDFLEDDGDVFGVYASYIGIDNVELDAYWLYVRDDVALLGTRNNLHTIGLRGGGVVGAVDFEAEAAYQFGGPQGLRRGLLRRTDIDYNEFAVNLELGYTFDAAWHPRVFGRFAYLGGGSVRRNWWRRDVDLPFNRLGSNVKYSEFLDNDPTSNLKATLSNTLFYSLGLQASPTEALDLKLSGAYFQVDRRARDLGWWWWRNRASRSIGWELGLYADYHYSDDLTIRAGYAHFFGKRGLERNAFIGNGLNVWGGDRRDDYDYLFIETEVSF